MRRVTYGGKGERYEHLAIRIMAKTSEPAVAPFCKCSSDITQLIAPPPLLPVLDPSDVDTTQLAPPRKNSRRWGLTSAV